VNVHPEYAAMSRYDDLNLEPVTSRLIEGQLSAELTDTPFDANSPRSQFVRINTTGVYRERQAWRFAHPNNRRTPNPHDIEHSVTCMPRTRQRRQLLSLEKEPRAIAAAK
jgi:hypothetical protein